MSQTSPVVTTCALTEGVTETLPASSCDVAPGSPMNLAAEVAAYLPLVRQIARHLNRKCPPNVQLDDLVAAGTEGLLDALRRSDSDRGKAFQFYASLRIRGAIFDELRASDWLSRRERLAARAHEDNCTTVVGFDDLPEGYAEVRDGAASPLEVAELRSEHAELAEAVSRLPEREANIVAMHYFRGYEFREIASELNVSKPRISQLHARAVSMLRKLMSKPARGAEVEPRALGAS